MTKKTFKKPRAGAKRLLVIPDTHAPYHSKSAWKAMVEFARRFKPDVIIHQGDFVDSRNASRHVGSIKYVEDYRKEILRAKPCFDDLDALGAKEKFWIKGNHDSWGEMRVKEALPALESMFLKVEDILEVRKTGWKVVPYGQSLRYGKVYYTHDTGSAGKQAHRTARVDHGFHNVAIGHTHHMALDIEGCINGTPRVALVSGWLGDAKHIDYIHSRKAAKWPHGFAVGRVLPNGETYFALVPIIKGRAIGPVEWNV